MQIDLPDLVDVVGFADPSSGKMSDTGCQNAIVIVGQDRKGRAFALAEWADRSPSDILTAKIFEMNRRWKCHRFGIESSGQQNLYFQGVIREANSRRERIALVPVEQPTNETKEYRITYTIQRWMHNGLVFVNRDCKTLLKQLTGYPHIVLVDVVDAFCSCLRLLRDPLASQSGLRYDDDLDETERFRRSVRDDPRYKGFHR